MSANAPKKLDQQPTLPACAPQVCLSAPSEDGTSRCETTQPVLLIGSRRDCHLPISHPDVSKTHCAIINTGREILVRDLLSRSGTFVNDQIIGTAVLRPGDTLRIGPAEVQVQFRAPPEEPPQADQPSDADAVGLATSFELQVGEQRVELGQNAVVIGRRNTADIVIDTPDASLAHALLFMLAGQPAISDLGSRSGTFLNGQRTEFSRLSPGDELEIGGQKLTVRWHARPCPAAPEPSKTSEQADASPAPPSDTPAPTALDEHSRLRAGMPADPADLGDLEQTIAAVQAQMSMTRRLIEGRKCQLERREAELRSQLSELHSRRDALAHAEAALEQRDQESRAAEELICQKLAAAEEQQQTLANGRAELAEAQAALEQQQQALDEATEACCKKEQDVRQREARMEATAAQLTEDRQLLEAEQTELEGRLAEHSAAVAGLEQHATEIDTREAALAARERDLAERESVLRQREIKGTAALEKIEQFKSALHRTSEMLTAAAGGDAATAQPESSAEPSANVPQQQAALPPTPPAEHASAAEVPAATDEELPAPMVDQPLFTTSPDTPPPAWPRELRERFRVLRRVSNKSDEELLAQVWEQREKTLHSRDGHAHQRGKRRRSFRAN